MKPPTRKRVIKAPRELQIEEYSRWTLAERQRLLKALEKYSVNQSSKIAKEVSTKSEAEVIYYITKQKRSLKHEAVTQSSALQRKYVKNIETWIRFTHRLVDDDEVSYSSMIGKLLALFGEYNFKKMNLSVNFKAIYDYLSGLLLGVQLPVLPPLEAAIVLDLLKNVATFLAQSDIAVHKKFTVLNYEKHMFPDSSSREEIEETISGKLLNEDMVPSGASSSSSSSPHDKTIPSTYQKNYTEELLDDGTKAMVVRLKRIDIPREQTILKLQSQESESSKHSSAEMESPGPSMTGTPKNSSAPITKQATDLTTEANTVGNGKKTLDQQNKSSEIPLTSKTMKSGMASLLSFGKKTAKYLHTDSAVQPDPKDSLPQQDPKDSPVWQDPRDPPVQQNPPGRQDPRDPPGRHDPKDPPVQQIKQEVDLTTDQEEQNSGAHPQENNIPQVSSDAQPLPLPNRDCPSVIQVPNGDTDQQKSSSSCSDQVPSQANVLQVPTKGTLLHLPNGGTLLHLPTGGTLLHLPNGGTIKKEQDGTSVFQVPSGSTVQQGPDSLSIFQGSNTPHIPQNPIGGTVQKRTTLSNLLRDSSGGAVQQRRDDTNISQTRKKRTILSRLLQEPLPDKTVRQETGNTKIFQVTSKGLVKQGSSGASPLQATSGGTAPQEASRAKVFQMTSSSASSLQMSNVQIAGRPHLYSVAKIVNQPQSVSAETQTPKSVEQTLKRKLFDVESGMPSKRSKRHHRKVNYKISDSESSDSDSEIQRQRYKPSVSWLNPMTIPASLINLTKTKKKNSR